MPSVREIGQKLPGIARLMRVQAEAGGPAIPASEPDPIEEAIRVRRQLAGARIQEAAVGQAELVAETEAKEARLRSLRVDLETAAAEQQRVNGLPQNQQPAESPLMTAILNMMQGQNQQLVSTNQELQNRISELTLQQNQSLQQQIAALSASQMGGVQMLSQQVDQVKLLRSAMSEIFPAPVRSPIEGMAVRSSEETLRHYQMQEDHEYRM